MDLLAERGFKSFVAPVRRWDWLRNIEGLRRAEYWKGTLQPLPTVEWYMKRIDSAIQEALEGTQAKKVSLVAHSAGGWMSRVYLLNYGTENVAQLLSLGSPHNPPPEGVIDQTRGILGNVTAAAPGAFHGDVDYVCVNGHYSRGQDITLETLRGWLGSDNKVGDDVDIQDMVVGLGYKQVCGNADVWGDGITPEVTGSLEGAKNVVLPGVYHSPLGAAEDRPWYGSEAILDQWLHHLI